MTTRADQAKVTFELPESKIHNHSTESVWAEVIGPDTYRIDNIPFFAYGVSLEDVVRAEPMAGSETRRYLKTIRAGGHSTYRVILLGGRTTGDSPEFTAYWEPLQSMGCSFEGYSGHYLAVDVPADADIDAAYAQLETGERDEIWSFEEGHCGHDVQS